MNTDLRLYAGVPISRDDLNFLDGFTSESTKLSYFDSYKFATFDTQQIQRDQKVMYVEGSIDEIEKCNYLSFRNGDGQRYWCFVTDVVYESDEATKLEFEVDFMTTWLNIIDIKDCMVEREHVSNDTIGNHTIDEGIDVGEIVTEVTQDTTKIKDIVYIFVATESVIFPPTIPSGAVYTGVYSGLWFFGTDDISLLDTWILYYNQAGKIDALITIFTMPKSLVNIQASGAVLPSSGTKVVTETVSKNYGSLDGYTPRNNKLYVYPYNYLQVDNNQGQKNICKYEYFSNTVCDFMITSNVAPSPVVYMVPLSYKGISTDTDEFTTLSDYPLVPWAGNTYATWLAQNQVSNSVKVTGSLGAIGVGIATGNLAVGVGGVAGLVSSIGTFKQQSILPDTAKGSSSGGANIAREKQLFTFHKKTVKAENARVIDDFFQMYGYKVNDLKTPNLKSRTYFNYIKTLNCNIVGEIPATDLKSIKEVFNKGVTFWHTKDVGNYQVNN